MKILIATFLFCTIYCFSQTALVVPLSPEDSAKYKRLYDEMIQAEKAWEDAKKNIESTYIILDRNDPEAGDYAWLPETFTVDTLPLDGQIITKEGQTLIFSYCPKVDKREEKLQAKSRRYRKGWTPDTGFEFSSGWKYIVPKVPEPVKPLNGTFLLQQNGFVEPQY